MASMQSSNTSKTGRRRPADNHTRPMLQPTVNRTAGSAATGVRVGFPANRTVNLTYCSTLKFSSTSGVGGAVQLVLNNAFDPEFAIGGHQPMGFDQWAAFYNHYVVESCDYEVTMSPIDAPVAMYYSTHLSDDSTVPNDLPTLVELGAVAGLWYPNTEPHIFRGHLDVAKFFNRKDIAADSELRSAVTAGPTEKVFLTVRCEPQDGGSSVDSKALLTLNMKVRFMEPKDLPPSSASRSAPAFDHRIKPPGFPKVVENQRAQPTDDMFQYVRVLRDAAQSPRATTSAEPTK